MVTKKVIYSISISMCVFISTTLFTSIANAEPIKIRFAHSGKLNTALGRMAIRFDLLVSRRLGDNVVDIEVFPDSSLYNNSQAIDNLGRNNLELAAPPLSVMARYAPRLKVMDLPFLFTSPEAANNFLKGSYGTRLLNVVQQRGFFGLGFLNSGMKQMTSLTPVKIPKDVASKKFIVMDSDVLESQYYQVGAQPIRISFSNINPLLDRGDIDGQESTWSNIFSQDIYKFQTNIIESNHGYTGFMLVANHEFWKKIPEDIRGVVEISLREAIEYGNQLAIDLSVEHKNKIISSGSNQLYSMTIEDRKLWVEAMKPLWDKFVNDIGNELILAAASAR